MTQSGPTCNDINEPGLKPVSEALQLILSQLQQVSGYQRIPIEKSKGRILASPLISPIDVPSHTNSAVDGFAFRHAEQQAGRPTQFKIAGTAFAGKAFNDPVPSNHCVQIMTGAALPKNLDTVIMLEQVVTHPQSIEFDLTLKQGQNVRVAGEDIKKNDTIFTTGKYLTACDIGLCASLGMSEINVVRPLKIAIASTGNELKDPGTFNRYADIFDSNRYSLLAALDRPDIATEDLGILPDDPELIFKSLQAAAETADIIITSGGVSVGIADYTKTVLEQAGKINFWKVAIKPGRPLAFGTISGKPFFGLPGNPVAVWVTFYQFILPAIDKMLLQHGKPIAPLIQATCLERLRKKPGRTEIQRGILELSEGGDWTVRTTGKQGSGRLSSMSRANAFIILDEHSNGVEIGDAVTVQPFAGLL